ncbi:hypothetical protein MRX96_010057 [Rhipicephalus microplus]
MADSATPTAHVMYGTAAKDEPRTTPPCEKSFRRRNHLAALLFHVAGSKMRVGDRLHDELSGCLQDPQNKYRRCEGHAYPMLRIRCNLQAPTRCILNSTEAGASGKVREIMKEVSPFPAHS